MSDSSREIRRATPAINHHRVRLAREARKLTQSELAGRCEGDLSVTALSQIETGASKPTRKTVRVLAAALDFPAGFFSRTGEPINGFFRSLRSVPAGVRKEALAQAYLVHDLTTALEQFVDLPEDELCDLRSSGKDSPDAAARRLRRHWGYDADTPIDNVVRHLENSGAVTARLTIDEHRIDAFSVPFASRPVVVLSNAKDNAARSRFDAAHEAGHLIHHMIEDAGEKRIEQEAHAFAAELLMPRTVFSDLLPTRVDWPRLIELKVTWRVSLQALMYRAKTLGVWSDATYLNAIKTVSKNGWRKDEPGDTQLGPPESPWLLRRALDVLAEDGIDVDDVARAAALPVADIERLVAATDTRRRL